MFNSVGLSARRDILRRAMETNDCGPQCEREMKMIEPILKSLSMFSKGLLAIVMVFASSQLCRAPGASGGFRNQY